MTLNDEQLLERIEKRPNRQLIEFGQKIRGKARMHLYGAGMTAYLTNIKGFEKPLMHEVRVKYAISNVDLFARVDKPHEKVFTARGGSRYFNLGDAGNQRAAQIAQNVIPGFSSKKWVEQFWAAHSKDDPLGLVFIEVDQNRNCYPTYKCINCIYEMELNGTHVEYVIFEVTNEEKLAMKLEKEDQVFRVVDDASDDIVIIKNDPQETKKVVRVPEYSFTQWFRKVPARVNGYVPNPDGLGFVSIYHKAWDLADAYLLENSIKISHKMLHGFPKYYEYADECIKCQGSGKVRSKTCSHCQGTGKKLMTSPGDMKMLDYPTKDTPKIDVPGGYIEPSKTYWEMVRGELAELEQKINQTIWGSKPTQKLAKGMGLSVAPGGTATATEVMDNRAPEIENLHKIADAAETMDKFILDHLILYYLNQPQYITKGGCSVNYGRRYLIEEPDVLLDRYVTARKEGLSPSILSGMYELYLEAKYSTDGVSLNLHKKLMKVEPFMHYTLAELKANGATPEELRAKKSYGDWLQQMDGDQLVLGSIQALQASFKTFCSSQPLPVEEKEDKPKPAAKKKPVAAK